MTRPAGVTVVLATVLLACGRGGADDAQQQQQVASAETTGGAWQLDYTVKESGVWGVVATAPGGDEQVKTEQHYRYTCTGSARLVREEESEGTYDGPVRTQCRYEGNGEFSSSVWREKMTATGVPDTTTLNASLVLDPDPGLYTVSLPTVASFAVIGTHTGATCQGDLGSRSCKWVPYTTVDTSGVNGASPTLRDQPLPKGATTLHGSSSGPFEDPLPPGTTLDVTWTLTLVGASKPKSTAPTVAIEGPPCACLDGERVPGARVTWVATASGGSGGGTFREFRVTSSGPAPRVVENVAGDDAARITLEPTRETGAVTLAAVYVRDGRETTATKDVSFCITDSIRVLNGERDFAFDGASPGVLEIPARARALYDGADASGELAWNFEPIGAAATTTMQPAHPTGGVVDVRYSGLPELNAAFGPKAIEVSLTKGSCACKRRDHFRAFFSPTATNHPPAAAGIAPGEPPTPNWYYYYAQTPAISGVSDVRYAHARFSRRDNRPAIAQFDEDDGHIYVTDLLWKSVCRRAVPKVNRPVPPSGAGNDGIDCVAESTRHEAQHRADWAAWWPHGYLLPADVDFDGVPLSVERAHPGCSATNAMSCLERPFTDVGDREINAYWVGWQWPSGSLDAQDWACGAKGKQWKDGVGCAE